jgi:putative ABC transport system permease protein
MMPGFAVRLAWRETRASWRHFAGLLACVALGVGAVVGVGSFAAGLDRTLGREARALMGGDLELRATRPLDAATEAAVADLVARGAVATRVRELVGMARHPGRGATALVEVKAVADAYPLYGRLEVADAAGPGLPLGPDAALVQPALLARLGLRVGDPLALGQATFTIAGVVQREPDRSAGIFTLGPRVLLGEAGLERTGLAGAGSRVRHRTLLRLPDTLDARATRAALARTLTDPTVRVASYDDAQPGLRRFFDQLTTYLGLVGLVSLLVGGIGVAASVTSFLRRRVATIAILKALGADSRVLVWSYLLQALGLGGLGSLAGVGLGLGVQALLTPLLAGFVPFEIERRLLPGAAARGVLLGLLITLLCALWPLLGLRAVPAALVLRHPVEPVGARTRRPWRVAAAIALALAALALWQAGTLLVGGIFVGAVVAALGLLVAAGVAAGRGARRLPRLPWLAWRQGLASLHRPGSQATGVIVALGVGVMLLVAVALLERSLDAQLDFERRREAPSFFFVDVQPDQAEAFTRAVAETGGVAPALIPVVRSRLVAVNGQPVTRERWEGREDAWRFTRDYVLTWAAAPPAGNVVTRGRWWSPAEAAARPPGPPQISVEEEAARGLGVDVGGMLAFDIQGVRVEAAVTSLRKVDWQSLSTNFFVIFSPGALDGAPLTYVGTARVPPGREAAVQDGLAAAFPNVTAIPVRDVLERITGVLDRIGVAIRLVALLVVGAGLTVMAGALAASRYQRLYESVVLKTLGATRAAVLRAFAVEYATLGLVAGLGGTLLGAALAWIVLRFVLDVPGRFAPAALALGVGGSVALALAVGVLATFRLLGEKPLPVLRRE